jgi:hypothetical protein
MVNDDPTSTEATSMFPPKATPMGQRGSSLDRARRPALSPEDMASLRCRHCGGPRLKLSYRRLDKVAIPGAEAQATQTVFIFRCAACEGFTTVCAGTPR